MGLKEHFRPNRQKIAISIFLGAVWTALFYYLPVTTIPIFSYLNLFYQAPIYSLIERVPASLVIFFILLSYPFACYVSRSGDWPKEIAFHLATFAIFSTVVTVGLATYNSTVSSACVNNSDCHFYCPGGSFNDNFVNVYYNPYVAVDCVEATAICENNRCRTFRVWDAESKDECKKIGGGYYEFLCYLGLAKRHNDTGHCDEIAAEFDRAHCYFALAVKLDELSLCSSIGDGALRKTCINELVEAPPDYHMQTPYEGDCEKRPPGSVCLSFSDGYTWLVYGVILSTSTERRDDYEVEVGKGQKADYYHILYTDFVKEVKTSS